MRSTKHSSILSSAPFSREQVARLRIATALVVVAVGAPGCGGASPPDASPPDTRLTSAPTGVLGATDMAAFSFVCDGAEGADTCTFECRLDDGAFEACSTPFTRSSLSDGEHSFEVRAVQDELTDPSPARAEFRVDGVAPSLVVTGPGGQVGAGSLSYAFACDESDCVVECALDDGAWTACTSPWSVTVSRGMHAVHLRATDAAGNVQLIPSSVSLDVGPGWRTVAESGVNVCAISDEGGLYCWGRNATGTLGDGTVSAAGASAPVRIGTATDWVSVGAHPWGQRMCATTSARELYCWGNLEDLGGSAEVTSPAAQTPARDVFAVSLGFAHACALDGDGRLECVGDNGSGQAGLGALPSSTAFMDVGTDTYRSVSGSAYHSCAVRADGRLVCWGDGSLSGHDAEDPVTVPTAVGLDSDWTHVSASVDHSCGLRAGELYCWGRVYGLADDAPLVTPTPTRVGAEADWEDVWTGPSRTCGRRAGGALWCTGPSGSAFGAGTDAPRYRLEEVPALAGARQLAFGGTSCVLDASNLLSCWSQPSEGSVGFLLGNGDNYRRADPQYVDGDWQVLEASSGGYHVCGIKRDGGLWCWGSNSRGELGVDDTEARVSPARVGSRTDWNAVSAGRQRTCGIASGALYCWGDNQDGRLGLPGNERVNPSVTLLDDTRIWSAISVGTDSACGISAGELYCWGQNYGGQLGLGDTVPRNSPTPVGAAIDWRAVYSHGGRACGLRSVGAGSHTLWCWGFLGPNDFYRSPIQVGSSTDWLQAAPGQDSDYAVNRAGELQAIGRASSATDPSPVFASASSATDWEFVANAGYSGACGVRTGGGLFCWGANEALLGTGNTNVSSQAPVARGTTFSAQSVTLAGNAFCALDTSGGRHCWGSGPALGMGLEWRTPQPVLTPND